MKFTAFIAAGVATFALTACSGLRQIDAQVESAVTPAATATAGASGAAAPALAGARYRFEQLPLQASHPGTAKVQALAQAALARAGLVRDDAGALITVQASAHFSPQWVNAWGDPYYYGWDDGWGYWPGRFYFGLGTGGFYGGGAWMWDSPTRYYSSRVSLILRDARSGQVLYETRAQHEGVRGQSDVVLQALFDAALKDFPTPPAGWRHVVIPLDKAERR